MKSVVLVLCLLAESAWAGDIYNCTDKAGKRQIQSLPCEAGQRETYRQSFTVQKIAPVAAPVYVPPAPQPVAYRCTTLEGNFFFRMDGCPARLGVTVIGNSGGTGTLVAPVQKDAIPLSQACEGARQPNVGGHMPSGDRLQGC